MMAKIPPQIGVEAEVPPTITHLPFWRMMRLYPLEATSGKPRLELEVSVAPRFKAEGQRGHVRVIVGRGRLGNGLVIKVLGDHGVLVRRASLVDAEATTGSVSTEVLIGGVLAS